MGGPLPEFVGPFFTLCCAVKHDADSILLMKQLIYKEENIEFAKKRLRWNIQVLFESVGSAWKYLNPWLCRYSPEEKKQPVLESSEAGGLEKVDTHAC